MKAASSKAHANIALAKYWGKCDEQLNLPVVPSLSLTLDGLWTETTVCFDSILPADTIELNGQIPSDREAARIIQLLDRVRSRSGVAARAQVTSTNNFPTASGLASSASGFAALAAAAARAADLDLNLEDLSRLARRSSASAARSIFGGFVELAAGSVGDDSLCARPLPTTTWDVVMLVVIIDDGRKTISSTEGMMRSATTSPYYDEWVRKAPTWFEQVRDGVLAHNLEQVGHAMELSTFAMHACALCADPAVLYWKPTTLRVFEHIRSQRERADWKAWCTMDAGPHVKVLCSSACAPTVLESLSAMPGVKSIIATHAGPPVRVVP